MTLHNTSTKPGFSTKPGLILSSVLLFIGLLIYTDYGMAWDEPIQREMGFVSYNYVFNGDDKLLTYIEKDHGVGFELPLVFLENAMKLTDSREIYLMRHLATHVFFLLCCFSGYILFLKLFRNQYLACVGLLLLVLQPRIYAHSFFNSKDAPFMAVFVLILYVAQAAFEKNKPLWYLLLGLCVGYATSIRILGVLLPPVLLLFMAIDVLSSIRSSSYMSRVLLHPPSFLVGFCAMLYISWPTLWHNPIGEFIDCYKSLSYFRWDSFVLFDGKMIHGTDIPGSYLPTWFAITVPLVVLFSGLIGMLWAIINMVRNVPQFFGNTPERNITLSLYCFIVPFLAIILLRSVVYDDWRHIYFVYPSFVLLALYAIDKFAKTRARMIVYAALLFQLAFIIGFMITAHPFQQVYFNRLVSHKPEALRKNYDYEYWGTAFERALRLILANDASSSIVVWGIHPTNVENNAAMLPPELRKRIVPAADREFANYMVTNYRAYTGKPFKYPKVYSIKVQGSTIVDVYKVK